MTSSQSSASKANFDSPFVTGGSWKKSPVTIIWRRFHESKQRAQNSELRTCIPPKSFPFLRSCIDILASLSKRTPSTIETAQWCEVGREGYDRVYVPSSIISTFVRSHLMLAFRFFLIFVTRSSTGSIPKPIPANEWMVTPPILQAAMPEVDVE